MDCLLCNRSLFNKNTEAESPCDHCRLLLLRDGPADTPAVCSKTPCTNVCSARDTINPENSLARSYDEAVSEKWHTTERQFLSWRVVRFGSLARPPCGRWYGLRPPL